MAGLPTRILGRTGVEVTQLGFGAMELRNLAAGPSTTAGEAEAILNAVLDAGVTCIDTSPDYGESEERIGASIARRRDEYFLASKCACVVGDPPPGESERPRHEYTPAVVRAGVEQSLRRMKTDHLDLVQLHGSPSRAELEERGTLGEMLALQAEGKVRFLGMSGTLPHLRDHIAMGVFDAFQIPYSAVQREHEDLISQAAEAGAGVVIRGGVARGAPTNWEGRQILGQPAKDPREAWQEAHIDDLLGEMSPHEFTLRFTLSHPQMHTTIVGTRNPAHLQENLAAAAKGPLPNDLYEQAKRQLTGAGAAPA